MHDEKTKAREYRALVLTAAGRPELPVAGLSVSGDSSTVSRPSMVTALEQQYFNRLKMSTEAGAIQSKCER